MGDRDKRLPGVYKPAVRHTQWQITKKPIANTGESKDQHLRLSSYLHMYDHASHAMHTKVHTCEKVGGTIPLADGRGETSFLLIASPLLQTSSGSHSVRPLALGPWAPGILCHQLRENRSLHIFPLVAILPEGHIFVASSPLLCWTSSGYACVLCLSTDLDWASHALFLSGQNNPGKERAATVL